MGHIVDEEVHLKLGHGIVHVRLEEGDELLERPSSTKKQVVPTGRVTVTL